ncbi:hypothetical protein EI94DRAFT_1720322 [Lactarius quietus]|nr:hypothetical protein EI94DRAFT_1720322 [Lactarius quietus]
MTVPVVAARTAGQVVLQLPLLPNELLGHITADAWVTRVPQLIHVGSRYNKPRFEGIWLIIMFISALAVPMGLNNKIFNALDKNKGENDFSAIIQTRWISFAILIGIMLVFFIPLGIWKSIGQGRLTKLIKQWEAEDARSRAPGTFVPVWTVKLSPLRPNTRLTITTPHVQSQSYFHPAAYMPSWINGPVDPGSNDSSPVANQGFEKAAMYGELPLYSRYDRNSSESLGERGVRPYSDEKRGLRRKANYV